MSLIDLKTKFKGLKHGQDRPGGGSSNQPYIVTDIPNSSSPIPNTPDSLGRGGLIAVKRAAQDVSRLTQMFVDFKSPAGMMFIPKMNVLSRTSVKTESSQGVGYGMGLINQGAYSPTSTLLQAASGFIGGHAELLGLNIGEWGLNRYEDYISDSTVNNRLTNLYRVKILGEQNSHDMVSDDPNFLLEYSGGPGSTLGVGTTRIPKAIVGQQLVGQQIVKDLGSDIVMGVRTLTPYQIGRKDKGVLVQNGVQEDFRKGIIDDVNLLGSSILSKSPSYKTQNHENRVHTGDPGKSNTKEGQKQVLNYSIPASSSLALDRINAWAMYKGTEVNNELKDLVQFNIAVLDNDSEINESVYLHFRAFLSEFSDNYQASHSNQTYVGRGESFNNYIGFDRNINLSFKVVAQSKAELIPMYKKLNYLASTLAPDYSRGGFMRGNILKLTIGGYLFEQPGILKSLSYNIGPDTTWEIGIDEKGGEDKTVKELPHIIEVTNFTFTPIHDFLVSKPENYDQPDQRYISLNNNKEGNGNYGDEYTINLN